MKYYEDYTQEEIERLTTLSDDQKKAIKAFKKAAANMGRLGLWTFMHNICVYGEDGMPVMDQSGSVSCVFIVDTVTGLHMEGGDF